MTPTDVRRLVPLLLSGLLTSGDLSAAVDLFDSLSGDWRSHWREEKLFTRATTYGVETDTTEGHALHATSQAAHAALVRRLQISTPTSATLGWRWKVASAINANDRERTRAGDDFAARVCVVFETSLWPLRTRSIHYVWSATQPVGTVYPSPYSANVGMVVLRSGNADAGVWQFEQRDVLADYRRCFGKTASVISAVAVLVDTDNTGQSAEAWFARLSLDSVPRWSDPTPAP